MFSAQNHSVVWERERKTRQPRGAYASQGGGPAETAGSRTTRSLGPQRGTGNSESPTLPRTGQNQWVRPCHPGTGAKYCSGRWESRGHIPIEVKNSACTQPRPPNQATSNTDTRSFMVTKGRVCKVFSERH